MNTENSESTVEPTLASVRAEKIAEADAFKAKEEARIEEKRRLLGEVDKMSVDLDRIAKDLSQRLGEIDAVRASVSAIETYPGASNEELGELLSRGYDAVFGPAQPKVKILDLGPITSLDDMITKITAVMSGELAGEEVADAGENYYQGEDLDLMDAPCACGCCDD